MIYFIDIVRASQQEHEPEILSRIIDHESSADDAKQRARAILAGVTFVGAEGVRVLDQNGREIFRQSLVE